MWGLKEGTGYETGDWVGFRDGYKGMGFGGNGGEPIDDNLLNLVDFDSFAPILSKLIFPKLGNPNLFTHSVCDESVNRTSSVGDGLIEYE